MVISDRFADSSRIYQGLGRASLGGLVDDLHALMIGKEPDLTILVDMDPAVGLQRALGRNAGEERFEGFGVDMQARMRQGFLQLAQQHDRLIVVDGNRPLDEVHADILSNVNRRTA